MGEFRKNLWAPWRMQYVTQVSDAAGAPDQCFLCRYAADGAGDAENLVLWRSGQTLTLLNRYPYTNGHLLVAPLVHEAELDALSPEVLVELALRLRDAQSVLRRAVGAQGFNIGINLGRCAGAGLPQHLHWHIVPRWNGDTNFVGVLGDTRVIPQALSDVYTRFLEMAAALRLPEREA